MADENKYTPFTQFDISVDLNEGVGGAKAQTYLNQYVQAIKNLTDESRAFASEIKRAKDKLTQTVYVEQGMQGAAQRAFANVRQRQSIMKDEDLIIPTNFSMSAPEVEQTRFTRKINDKYRRADVASYVARHGGVMEKNPVKEGYYDIIAPRAVIGETPKGEPKYLDTEIKRKIRRINDAKKRQEEREHQERIAREQEAAKESIESGAGYGGSSGGSRGGGGRKVGVGTAMGNRNMLNTIKTGVGVGLVIKAVVEVVKLLGKIYQLVSQVTGRALSDSTIATGLGIKPYEVREYRVFEEAKGIQEGSFIRSIAKINATFGRLQSLAKSDSALENVAPFLQEDIIALVDRARGTQTSTDVMEIVFNKVIKQVTSGVDVLGNKTDTKNALVSHISALEASGVFSDLVPILERFFFEYFHMNTTNAQRGRMRAGGFTGWVNESASIINAAGISSHQYDFAAEVGSLQKEVKALVDVLKEGIAIHFTGVVEGALLWIEKFLRNFMDPRAARDKVNSVKTNLLEQKMGAVKELSDLESLDEMNKQLVSDAVNLLPVENRGILNHDFITKAISSMAEHGNYEGYEILMASFDEEGQSIINQLAYFAKLKKNLRKAISDLDTQLRSNNPKDISANKNTAIADTQTDIVMATDRITTSIENGAYIGFLNEKITKYNDFGYGAIGAPTKIPEQIAQEGAMEKRDKLREETKKNAFAVSGNAHDFGLKTSSLAMARQFGLLQYGKFINERATDSQRYGSHVLSYGVAKGVVYLDILDAKTGKQITERMALDTNFNTNMNDTATGTMTVDPQNYVNAAKMGVSN